MQHTGAMSMRTSDIDIVRLWCREQPQSAGTRVEPMVTGRHIDLELVSAPAAARDAVRTPFARLRYLHTGWWVLYWRDGGGSFHAYRNLPPSEDVPVLLAFLAADAEPLFWVEPAT